MWDQLPSYADATKTYEEWREEVKAFYPTADANRKYTLQDLDLLIGERSRLGISTAADLETIIGIFQDHRVPSQSTELSTSEIARTFYKPFTPTLWQSMPRTTFYMVTRVDAPAQGTPAAATTSTALPPGTIKTEDFTSLIETVTRTIAQAFATSANMAFANANHRRRESPILRSESKHDFGGCHYCGEFGHVIGGCPKVQEDIDIGRIRRNIENKVVLPSGAFVPRNVTGATMRDRILEWHRSTQTISREDNLARIRTRRQDK
ncbi:hypothetical protein A0H81_06722 [Grifola frondosa]|uniref:CCHC-type domain-containing protein n=1 Tax=Grifola frondosa TaxID=5627 RepID=A0A1C7M7G2_GRIFR|nr:hypothetical protein A0H81_06722 [Grifola frondosa]